MLIRIEVTDHAFARVRRQVKILLQRELVRLVDKYPVARATFGAFGIIIARELNHACTSARGVRALAVNLTRRLVHVKQLAECAPAPQNVLRVLVRSAPALLTGHARHVHHVTVVVRVQQQPLHHGVRLAGTARALQAHKRQTAVKIPPYLAVDRYVKRATHSSTMFTAGRFVCSTTCFGSPCVWFVRSKKSCTVSHFCNDATNFRRAYGFFPSRT